MKTKEEFKAFKEGLMLGLLIGLAVGLAISLAVDILTILYELVFM